MQSFSWTSILFYVAFGIFVYYQQLHTKNFQGDSEGFHMALNLSIGIGMIVGLLYLVNYGIATTWWVPIVIFVIGILGTFVGVIAERIIGTQTLSLAGFIGWPLCAYYMFAYIPKTGA
ncbi:hypothetical protein [Janthinobacterium sp. PSPC3-1]|uniref:hypothetical protein n=1 Tax=Janthinobacterium sp. PSPC3-1 TaxID=2804653 RepID=UPI003CE8EEBA